MRPELDSLSRSYAILAASLVLAIPVSATEFQGRAKALAIPAHAKAGTGIEGDITPSSLSHATFAVNLPDGRSLTFERSHVERDALPGSTTWTGTVPAVEGSLLSLTRYRGAITGTLTFGDDTYEIRPAASGRQTLYAVDARALPPDEPPMPRSTKANLAAARTKFATLGLMSADAAPVTQDLAVLYSAASLARYGQATLESMIVNAVALANQSYRDSGVGITLRLVGLASSSTVEASGMQSTLDHFRANAQTAQFRDSVGADAVLLVNEDKDWCGYANIMQAPSLAYASYAHGVVSSNCLSGNTLTHELGHIQGLKHDRETDVSEGDGALPYGHGYRVCQSGGMRDIMAYQCTNGVSVPRLALFSSPNLRHDGHPLGIAYETDPAHSADAVRALNETAALVASYRSASSAPAPGMPTGLTALSGGGMVVLAWTDASADEAGFKIERSRSGRDYVEVATVGANVATFTDTTVRKKKTYSYRVKAYGSAGTSAASNVATVTVRKRAMPAGVVTGAGDPGTTLRWTLTETR